MLRILLLYNSIEKCKYIENIFYKYNNIICDYDINLSIYELLQSKYEYDIVICELINDIPIIHNKYNYDTIFIANATNMDINEEYISTVMQQHFDICMFGELEPDSISHMLHIYYVINSDKQLRTW